MLLFKKLSFLLTVLAGCSLRHVEIPQNPFLITIGNIGDLLFLCFRQQWDCAIL